MRKLCGESRSVQWATLAEARAEGERAIRYLVGLRMGRRASVPFLQMEERISLAMTSDLTGGRALEVTELDSEVSATMSDGSPNPYVVFKAPLP